MVPIFLLRYVSLRLVSFRSLLDYFIFGCDSVTFQPLFSLALLQAGGRLLIPFVVVVVAAANAHQKFQFLVHVRKDKWQRCKKTTAKNKRREEKEEMTKK